MVCVIVPMSCHHITWQLLLSIWYCMAQTVFVYSRCSAHRDAGGMCGFSGGSATTGHMDILQGSHTAQWDLLAESRAISSAQSYLLSSMEKLRNVLRQVRHKWIWNRAGQHCHQNMELDGLQGPHWEFKEVFVCAAQLLASLCDWCPLTNWDEHLPRCCPFSTHYNKAWDFY